VVYKVGMGDPDGKIAFIAIDGGLTATAPDREMPTTGIKN